MNKVEMCRSVDDEEHKTSYSSVLVYSLSNTFKTWKAWFTHVHQQQAGRNRYLLIDCSLLQDPAYGTSCKASILADSLRVTHGESLILSAVDLQFSSLNAFIAKCS